MPIGVALALVLRRPDLPGRAFWRVAVLLPVLVPDFVLGYSWTQAYARGGFTDTVLGVHWAGLSGPVGVWLVLVVNAAPLVYLVVAVGLAARAEPDLERAARVSGAGADDARTVTLRLALPAVTAAAVLVFVLTLGTFAIPQVLGAPAGFDTVTTRIYADLSIGGDPASFLEAVTLALLLVLVAAALRGPGRRVPRPPAAGTRPADAQGTRRCRDGGRSVGPAVAPAGYLFLDRGPAARGAGAGLGHPRRGRAPDAGELEPGPLPPGAHAAHRRGARAERGPGRRRGDAARPARRHSWRSSSAAAPGRLTATLVTLTLVLPGSTLAVALLITYGRWLSGTLALILLAYLAKLWAFAHRPIAGALDRLPPDELRAARASGAGPLTAVRTVALRPLAPALLGAWLICFLTALHEVTMSSLLYGPGSETLAVIVLNSQELGRIGPTAALSVVLFLLVAVPALACCGGPARTRAASCGSGPVSR